MSEIRNNPPESVVSFEERQMYKTLYDDITDNGVLLQYHDRHPLGELAVIICEMNTLRAEIRKSGESMQVQGDRHVVTKKNPARDALEKIRPQAMRLMKEFNMTPSSRKSPSTNPGNSETRESGYGDI
jgi:hypothetical protein